MGIKSRVWTISICIKDHKLTRKYYDNDYSIIIIIVFYAIILYKDNTRTKTINITIT